MGQMNFLNLLLKKIEHIFIVVIGPIDNQHRYLLTLPDRPTSVSLKGSEIW